MAMKNWRARKMPNTAALSGRMTAQRLPYRPRLIDTLNWATMIAWTGIIIVDSSSRNSALRPRKRILAKA